MKRLVSMLMALMMICMLVPAMAEEDVTGDWYMIDMAGVNPVRRMAHGSRKGIKSS